ncbi:MULTISPECIES: cytochrome P450 [Streptomyces]|jgi:cytochrome P450|uniref:cytochrome P450 n=1 Tax=Streptomyces TaxID=1883 RepID=UPI00163C50F6|nr:cytochrome P450 [Streptomyces sp. WAC05292]
MDHQQRVLDALDADDPAPHLNLLAGGPAAVDCPDLGSGRLVLTRHADVRRALRDDAFGCAPSAGHFLAGLPAALRPALAPVSSWALYTDGADHRRLRSLLAKAFTPRRIAALEAGTTAAVRGLLGRLAAAGGGDAVRGLAFPLPVLTISELLGLPAADRDLLKQWSDDLIRLVEPDPSAEDTERIGRSWTALWEYFGAVVAERRARPADDVVSGLVRAEADGARLTSDEIVSNCVSLLLGGHETTTGLLTSLLTAVRAHPGPARDAARSPAAAAAFVEEVLRTDGPSKITARTVLADTEIAGVPVARGRRVVLLLASANRDPLVFDRPGAFDPTRAPNPHLAFGHGPHACFGAALARLQARIVLEQYAAHPARFTALTELTAWKPSRVLRSACSLPLATARGRAA